MAHFTAGMSLPSQSTLTLVNNAQTSIPQAAEDVIALLGGGGAVQVLRGNTRASASWSAE
jgi:hypothetical protein